MFGKKRKSWGHSLLHTLNTRKRLRPKRFPWHTLGKKRRHQLKRFLLDS
jgi:hypothetical protein